MIPIPVSLIEARILQSPEMTSSTWGKERRASGCSIPETGPACMLVRRRTEMHGMHVAFACWLALSALLSSDDVLAATDGTLVILRNTTNSAPRIISTWGGAETQIILKSDGTVWTWGLNSEGQLGNGTTNSAHVPFQVLGPGGVGYLGPVT